MQLKNINYETLLKLLIDSGYPNKNIIDNPTEKSWIIRHDVDNHLDKSVQMSKIEHDLGVTSTYYLLNFDSGISEKDNYFYKDKSLKEYELLINRGHQIGWHNNAITEHLMTKKSIIECINTPLSYLRNNLDCYINTTASHGDRLCHKYNYINYEIWNEFECKNNLNHERFDLKEFGFEVEAYQTNRTHYLSESGGNWSVDAYKQVQEWIEYGEGNLQILVHPQWWG